MAITLSKLFMRTISQNPNENQTGISLWTIEDIAKAQEKQREQRALEAQQRQDDVMDEDEEDYGNGGFDDDVLANLDLDV